MLWGVRSRWKRNETRASTPSPSLHKCIKNTSACGTPPAEHLLKIMAEDHRPPNRQVNLHRISLWVSRMFLSFEYCFHLSGVFSVHAFFICMTSVCVFVFNFFPLSLSFFPSSVLYVLWSPDATKRGQTWNSEMEEPHPTCWTTRELPAPWNVNWWEASQRPPSQHQGLAPLKGSKLPGLEDTCQIISKIGRQHCLLTHRLRRAIPSPQTPQNTPLAAASPFRETRASSTQQNTGTSPCKPRAVTDTSPSPPTGGRTHKEEELQPSICRKDTPHAENQTKWRERETCSRGGDMVRAYKRKGKLAQACPTLCDPWAIQPMGFSRPEYWSGEPLPSPEDLPIPGIKPRFSSLQVDSLPAEPQGKPKNTAN